MDHALFTPEEASRYLGIAVPSLAVYRCQNRGPRYYKIADAATEGRSSIVYKKTDMDRWIRQSEKSRRKYGKRSLCMSPDRSRDRNKQNPAGVTDRVLLE